MSNSNYKHLAAEPARAHVSKKKTETTNTVKKVSKLGSIIASLLVVCTAVVIPSVTFVQNVEAATSEKNIAFSVGDASVFANAISDYDEKLEEEEAARKKADEEKQARLEAEEEAAAEAEAEESYDDADDIYVEKNNGLFSVANSDTSYTPGHIELSYYDRDLVERVTMGEAGTLGYTGAALVAQAIRDSMVMSGTSSADYIISNYQYDGSIYVEPSDEVKSAVSYIFDSDGYAVDHRILYFYASDIVDDAWHESQQFIVSYGNVRFFDMW